MDRLTLSLFDATVDLNPHQIEAALFALESPLAKGVVLADEVGLGKTIEAGIVLCQLWAERRRRLLVLCPASIRKQWALELEEKFNLPTRVLDARTYAQALREGRPPLAEKAILLLSFHYAHRLRDELKSIAWDLVVIDEAHKLRNAYRPSNKVGQGIRWATEGRRKLLLTPTPLQNSLLELYGLASIIDEHLFGDVNAFRAQYAGARRKALVFTESRRTQEYLKEFLESNGHRGQVVLFNGTNGGPEVTAIYERWVARNTGSGRAAGSRAVDVRTALIEHFRDEAEIMIATEAGAEGVNLQFCSLVINHDLPWNPQRIEQRIGRCHRYGQEHDVVVINFLNERNAADQRVLELLAEKFKLFSGIFGASDEVLGSIESGVDFEKRILAIYQECRTEDEIEAAFKALQTELDEQIRTRLDEARETLFEHFDEDVHGRLRLSLADARAQLDRVGKRFWSLTRFMLDGQARFDDEALAFDLECPPREEIRPGRYHLISKAAPQAETEGRGGHDAFLYRLSHPLGQHVLESAKGLPTPPASIVFDVSGHPTRVLVVEALRGRSGFLTIAKLCIETYEREEHLLFSGFDEQGHALDQETMEKLFGLSGRIEGEAVIPAATRKRLAAEVERHAAATVSRSLDGNNRHFQEAREKLEQWADDRVLAAEKALTDTKQQIKARRREARQAATLEEQHRIQETMRKLERQQRRQRKEIFQAEDEILERRDQLIDQLEQRLVQKVETARRFTIRWRVV